MSKKLITTISVTVALGSGAIAIPVAGAHPGPPPQGGGCNMVYNPPLSTGLTHMMTGSANGQGAAKMSDMLSRFSSERFCGIG